MNITKEETSPREVALSIQLESSDIEPYLERSYKRLVNRLMIPGFRRGKAPRYMVENYVGKEAMVQESLEYIVQESLDKAIKEENLETFGEPDVEVLEVYPTSFKATVSLEPIVDLGDFRSLRLEPDPIEVTEEQVAGVLEQIRYESAPWDPVDGPVKFGNLVTMEVVGVIEGRKLADDKGVDFIPSMDNPHPFPGFSVYLEGMRKDVPKEFDLTVPEDYADKTLAGKECRFNVKVLEIKEKVLLDLNDEFAKGVGDGYESLEALRANVLENLTQQAERAGRRAFEERSLEEVLKGTSVEVSDLTANREIDHLLEERIQSEQGRQTDMDTYLQNVGKSQEELRDELRPTAQERLTRFLVLRKLAQEEGIEVSPEDVDSEVENLSSGATESGGSLREALSSERAKSSIGSAILTRKVLERLAQIVQGGVQIEGPTADAASDSTHQVQESALESGVAESDIGSPDNEGAGPRDEEEGGNPIDS